MKHATSRCKSERLVSWKWRRHACISISCVHPIIQPVGNLSWRRTMQTDPCICMLACALQQDDFFPVKNSRSNKRFKRTNYVAKLAKTAVLFSKYAFAHVHNWFACMHESALWTLVSTYSTDRFPVESNCREGGRTEPHKWNCTLQFVQSLTTINLWL